MVSESFGQTRVLQDNTSVNLRFPGQYWDAETETHYNYHRDYSPQLGRYLQSDPIGLEGGINTYGYAINNPLVYIDPVGRAIAAVGLGSGATVGARYGGAVGGPVGALIGAGIGVGVGIAVGIAINNAEGEDSCSQGDGKCPPCNPPEGKKYNITIHYNSHSLDPNKGSHGCMQKTGSPVHWHYSVQRQNPITCECFEAKHLFGGCGMPPLEAYR